MSHSTSTAVVVNQLSRSFRGKQALRNVDLTIPRGAVFGLVGLNGAGKTTLIRHLMGLLIAKHGTVRVLGQDPTESPEILLKRVGYMTEEDSLPKWMRVGDMLDFSRAIYPTWDDAYGAELCEMFGLSRHSKLCDLSKGQRARVGLLVAITHRPELLILDEPSSGLDPIARSDILEAIIRTVSEEGRTVLFSSHLLDEVDRVCDSVALMSEGRIVESLSVEALQSQYREIICHPSDRWSEPPEISGVFGWKSSGDEWSAVVDRRECDPRSIAETLPITQERDISMLRWFSARANEASKPPLSVAQSSGSSPSGSGPSDSEALHHG